MRVAHFFSGNPISGAASGALNLCNGLLKEGIEISIYNNEFDFLVRDNKFYYKENFIKKINSFKNNILDRIVISGLQDKIKFSSGIIGNFPIEKNDLNNYDLIHLHWINNGFINLHSLKNIHIPIVWTIRDMWPLTGGCHYSLGCKKYHEECSSCPNLKSFNPFKDQIKKIFNIKQDVISNLKLNLVPISKWLENEINQSKILKDQSVTQIYNCVDNNIFYPSDYLKDRNELNLPQDKFIILVGSQKLNDKIKNNNEILNLVNKFNQDYYFVSFGKFFDNFSNIRNFGFIKNREILRKLYSSANVYLSFAKEEAFGKTLVESLMCNTPVISNDNISAQEIIKHKYNGYLVNNDNYYDAIKWINKNINKNLKKFNLENLNKFSVKQISKEYINLYKNILNEQKK